MKKLFYLIIVAIIITSCGGKETHISHYHNAPSENLTPLSKKNSVEIAYSTKELNDKYVLLITTQRIWKDSSLVKEIIRTDTLPGLGKTKQKVADSLGVEKELEVNRQYEFFVTINSNKKNEKK